MLIHSCKHVGPALCVAHCAALRACFARTGSGPGSGLDTSPSMASGFGCVVPAPGRKIRSMASCGRVGFRCARACKRARLNSQTNWCVPGALCGTRGPAFTDASVSSGSGQGMSPSIRVWSRRPPPRPRAPGRAQKDRSKSFLEPLPVGRGGETPSSQLRAFSLPSPPLPPPHPPPSSPLGLRRVRPAIDRIIPPPGLEPGSLG